MISDTQPAPNKRGTPSAAPPVPSAAPEKKAKASQAPPTKSVSRVTSPEGAYARPRSAGAKPAPAASGASSVDAQEELAMDATAELLAALRQLVEIVDATADTAAPERAKSRSSKRGLQRPRAKQLLGLTA